MFIPFRLSPQHFLSEERFVYCGIADTFCRFKTFSLGTMVAHNGLNNRTYSCPHECY